MSFKTVLQTLSREERHKIKETLILKKKKTIFNQNPDLNYSFAIDKNKKYIYLPLRLWPDYHNTFPNTNHTKINIDFNRTLLTKETDFSGRDRDQLTVYNSCVQKLKKNNSCLIGAFTGFGKCLGFDTPVLMYNGTTKCVQNLKIGDLVMGPDSNPRKIKSLGSGRDQLFKIYDPYNSYFITNSRHIVSIYFEHQIFIENGKYTILYLERISLIFKYWYKLKSKSFDTRDDAYEFFNKHNNPFYEINIQSLLDILNSDLYSNDLYSSQNCIYIYRCVIDYNYFETIKKRYIMVRDDFLENISNYVNKVGNGSDLEFVNNITQITTSYDFGVYLKKHIYDPHHLLIKLTNNFITSNLIIRYNIISGLLKNIDTVNGELSIKFKSEKMKEIIKYILLSIGVVCYDTIGKSILDRSSKYYTLIIPILRYEYSNIKNVIEHKKLSNYIISPFKISKIENGDYYGFTLSCDSDDISPLSGNTSLTFDNREIDKEFVLGNFYVTHNTTLGNCLIANIGLRAAIICHSDIIKKQWRDDLINICNAKVQIVKGNKPLDPSVDVYIFGVLKASNMKRKDLLDIGTLIMDEVHMATVTAFTKSLLNFQPKYLIGLSATPDRKDGMDKLLNIYFGKKKDFIIRHETKKFTIYKYKTKYKPAVGYIHVQGKLVLDWNKVVNSLEGNEERWEEICNIVKKHPKEKIIILSLRVIQAKGLYDLLLKKGESVELFIGNKRDWDKSKRILITTLKKGGTGLNDPSLTMLILASSTKDVRQFEGRIRTTDNIIYDMVDNFGTLEKHWKNRYEWYVKKGGTVVNLVSQHSGNDLESGIDDDGDDFIPQNLIKR